MDILYLEGSQLGVGILVMNHNTLVIANLRGIRDLYIVDGFWLLREDFKKKSREFFSSSKTPWVGISQGFLAPTGALVEVMCVYQSSSLCSSSLKKSLDPFMPGGPKIVFDFQQNSKKGK